MNCQNCNHFLKHNDEQGLCRRYPPTILVTPEGGLNSFFPPMLNDGLCGEHQEKTND